MSGDEADAKKLRRCLLRNVDSASTSSAAEEEDDTVDEVSVGMTAITHLPGTLFLAFWGELLRVKLLRIVVLQQALCTIYHLSNSV